MVSFIEGWKSSALFSVCAIVIMVVEIGEGDMDAVSIAILAFCGWANSAIEEWRRERWQINQ